MVVIDGYVVMGDDLLHRSITEEFLSNQFKFMELETLEDEIDGNYLIFDKNGTCSFGVDVQKRV